MLKLRNTAKDIPELFVYRSESNPLMLGGSGKDKLPKCENLQEIDRSAEEVNPDNITHIPVDWWR